MTYDEFDARGGLERVYHWPGGALSVRRYWPPHGWMDEFCPGSPGDDGGDGMHCRHWWDGDPCCWCDAGEMPMDDKVAQGMVEGPLKREQAERT